MFTAERCWKLANCYETMAQHDSAPAAVRVQFARKANLYRIKARLAEQDEAHLALRKSPFKQLFPTSQAPLAELEWWHRRQAAAA
jgi:hypothetical protein